MKQVLGSPILTNLVRTLAFQKRTMNQEPLAGTTAEQLQCTINDISDTLRTILCL